jgi:hypothetical protein
MNSRESLQNRINQLEKMSHDIETQIHELYEKQSRYQREMADCNLEIQKMDYNGLSRSQYFKSIEGTRFTEGDYTIVIGEFYPHSLSVKTMEDDMELTVNGRYDVEGGSLNLYRRADRSKGTKHYDKTYYPVDVPKSRRDEYGVMVRLKKKYAQMMANAEIKPKEEK